MTSQHNVLLFFRDRIVYCYASFDIVLCNLLLLQNLLGKPPISSILRWWRPSPVQCHEMARGSHPRIRLIHEFPRKESGTSCVYDPSWMSACTIRSPNFFSLFLKIFFLRTLQSRVCHQNDLKSSSLSENIRRRHRRNSNHIISLSTNVHVSKGGILTPPCKIPLSRGSIAARWFPTDRKRGKSHGTIRILPRFLLYIDTPIHWLSDWTSRITKRCAFRSFPSSYGISTTISPRIRQTSSRGYKTQVIA